MAETQVLHAFRKATTADAKDLQLLLHSAFYGGSGRAGFITEYDYACDIDVIDVLAKISQKNGLIVLAHNHFGVLVGCCEIQGRPGGLGYYGLVAIDASRQGGGLGGKLLTEAAEMAKKDLGIRMMETRVDLPRQTLLEWYIRKGKL